MQTCAYFGTHTQITRLCCCGLVYICTSVSILVADYSAKILPSFNPYVQLSGSWLLAENITAYIHLVWSPFTFETHIISPFPRFFRSVILEEEKKVRVACNLPATAKL
jgi:hypothetical protein